MEAQDAGEFAMNRLIIVAGILTSLSLVGCASSKSMTQTEADAAMKKCFETYTNFPIMRNECINHVRTADTETAKPTSPPATASENPADSPDLSAD